MRTIGSAISAALATVLALAPAASKAQTCPSGFSVQDLKMLADDMTKADAASGVPLHPAISGLASRTIKNYGCQSIMNYYTVKAGMRDDLVSTKTITDRTSAVLSFSSNIHPNICGSITYTTPRGLVQTDSVVGSNGAVGRDENAAYIFIADQANIEFIDASNQLGILAHNLAGAVVPEGVDAPRPTAENAIEMASDFQVVIVAKFTEIIKQRKWTRAQVDHFANISQCAPVLPEVRGPNLDVLNGYGAIFERYKSFAAMLDQGLK